MGSRKLSLWTIGVVSALGIGGRAEAQDMRIWPAPFETLWGLERTNCSPELDSKAASAKDQPELSAKIHPELCQVFNGRNGEVVGSLVRHFNSQIKDKIPQPTKVVSSLAEGLPAGVPISASLQNTLVASLHISRADLWIVDKLNSQDVFLPYTLTLNFTNAASGEVVFTVSESIIPQGTFTKTNGIAEARVQLENSLSNAVTSLVDKAAATFKPYAIPGKILEKVGDKTFVFDKGRQAGVREGDTIGADAVVTFVDAGYSIINAGKFPLEIGQKLTKTAAKPVDALARPSVFVTVAEQPSKMSANYLRLLFEQQLGQGNALTVMPGNESFSQIRRLMIQVARAPDIDLFDRPLPDYVFRIRVYALPPTRFSTNLPGVRMHSYEAHALAELLDRSGRVVYAANVANKIDDKVAANVAFSEDARQDTVVSNALKQLADKVSSEFKPKALRVPITARGETFGLDDPGGSVGDGSSGLALRKKGKISGIEGDVWLPTGRYSIVPAGDGNLVLRGDGLGLKLKQGDAFGFESGAAAVQSRISYSRCSEFEMPSVGTNGELLIALAENRFVANYAAPSYLSGFGSLLDAMMDEFTTKKKAEMGAIARAQTDRCFRPIVRLTRGAFISGKNGTVVPSATVAAGFTLHAGDTKIAGGGMQAALKGGSVPADAPEFDREVSIVRDFAATVTQLTDQWSKTNKPPQ